MDDENLEDEPRFVYRSAATGRFVSEKYARRYPHRAKRERVEPPREPYIQPIYPDPRTVH